MTFDLVDDYGTPLGEFASRDEAIDALREIVGSSTQRAYDFAVLVFDDDDKRVGGPITLDPRNLSGPPIQHAVRAPAPPSRESTVRNRSYGVAAIPGWLRKVEPVGSSAVGAQLYRFPAKSQEQFSPLPAASSR